MLGAWSRFSVYSLGLLFFGYFSCKYASVIVKKSRMSAGFMGVFFLAIATSAPEIITASVAVSSGSFDLAIGDICGSLLINLFILIVLDLFCRRSFLKKELLSGNLVLVFILQFILLAAIFMRGFLNVGMEFFSFGFENFLIILFYFLFLKRERSISDLDDSKSENQEKVTKHIFRWTVFVVFLCAIAVFGRLMVSESKIIVEKSGLNDVFFGTLFLGFVTSLPELVVTVSAIFNGSWAMAVGNILGSNALDVAIVPILEILTAHAPILSMVSTTHVVSVCFLEIAVILLFILIRAKKFVKLYEVFIILLLIVPLLVIF
ncbi:MAG: hypothetical protein P9M06_06835 [Candidatus Saelkia tenebricola]|nr:hypothetical protein [Candidatus Saelkia tenebricola]